MLLTSVTHPEILHALASAGHGSRVLLSDGNYPLATAIGPNAEKVFLNLCPGQVPVTDILAAIASVIEIEAASVMQPDDGSEPSVFPAFREILPGHPELQKLSRHDFYSAARGPDVALAIQSGDSRLYANILLTIGVAH